MQRLLSAGIRAEYVKYPIYDLDPTGKQLNEILRGKQKSTVQTLIDFFPGTKVKRPGMPRRAGAQSAIFRTKEIGKRELKQRVSEEELQMWYSLNRYQFDPILRRKLAQGISVVAEDYTGTGLAWGSAKGADLGWLESVNKYLMKPDLELLMDGQRFLAGKEKVHLHESSDRLIGKAQTAFQKLAKKYGWEVVNANQSVQAVSDTLWNKILPLFPRRREGNDWIAAPAQLRSTTD
jgi:thymidylate kinase